MLDSQKLFKKNYIQSIYIVFLGVFSSYSLPPYNFFIINFITFSLFFIFLFNKRNSKKNKWSFFIYGWLFGFGYFLSNLYWISISLTFDESFKIFIPFVTFLLPAFLSIFYGFMTYLFLILRIKNVISSFFLFSILFGFIEFIRGSILTGFPWNLISFSFSENIYFIQILSVIGTYSFNLICISLFTLPAIFILRKSKKEIIVCFLFILLSVGSIIFGNLRSNEFDSLKITKNPYKIRVVSPNISLERFYSKKDETKIINELINLSVSEKKEPTIFLWPEGIIPDTHLKDIIIYKDLFKNNFHENDVIIMGLNSTENRGDKILLYNSLAVFDSKLNLKDHYNKINLVPFGEFVPMKNFLSYFGLKTITNEYRPFSPGNKKKLIKISNNGVNLTLLPLICYEIIYSGKLSNEIKFDYIINISEDGWFGKSIGPKQHFAHSIFRSVESGKYIIRSANNGISGIINPLGIVENKIKFGSTGYIDFTESKSIKSTTFMIYGNKIFFILILLYIFLIFSFKKISNE